MFDGAPPVLAMVSGGADSVAMLRMLASGSLGEMTLEVLHVNHLLRDVAAEADERFVARLCGSLGVACHCVRYDVGAYAEAEGLNLEDAGRRVRYRFADEELDALCGRTGVQAEKGRIAVAHTVDDRVETFFMRAISGSGTGGLASIAPVRGRVVRPLLGCGRDALRDWLREIGQDWREDETNSDTVRTRALVRAEILPVAARINPSYRAALARSMDLLADDDGLLSMMASAFAYDFADVSPGDEVSFDRQSMGTLDRTMARRTVREALARAFPEASRLGSEHVEMLVDGLASPSFARDLPDGLRAQGEYDRMVVSRAGAPAPAVAPTLLSLPGIAELGSAGIMRAEASTADDTAGASDSIVIDAGALDGELVVDGFREGDRMQPLGMKGTRKLSDLLIDAKVPKRRRGAVPVVRDGDRIVWVAGVRMAEEYKVVDGTQEAFRLTWDRGSAWQ